MLVKDLIAQLQECDPDAIVVMSSDGEGNNKSPLADIDDSCVYIPDSTWSGDTKLAELTPELEAAGYGEEDCVHPDEDNAQPCVILWPTN